MTPNNASPVAADHDAVMIQGLDEPAESETRRFIEILNLAAPQLLTAPL
jgi:hypothetical protein